MQKSNKQQLEKDTKRDSCQCPDATRGSGRAFGGAKRSALATVLFGRCGRNSEQCFHNSNDQNFGEEFAWCQLIRIPLWPVTG